MKILCLGNNTSDSEVQSRAQSLRYNCEPRGLLVEGSVVEPGCYHTDIGTISVDYLRSVVSKFDLIILLDQPISSYSDPIIYYQSLNTCVWLKNQQQVEILSQHTWIYMTKSLNPHLPNVDHYRVTDNVDLLHRTMSTDIREKNLILQLSNIGEMSYEQFIMLVESLVHRCRYLDAQFVLVRADEHENDDLHFKITHYLSQIPEFVLLTPGAFQDLTAFVLDHWKKLYGSI